MIRTLALLSALLSFSASAADPDQIWNASTALIRWTASTGPVVGYRVLGQTGGSSEPWGAVAMVTEPEAIVLLPPCRAARFAVDPLGAAGAVGPRSDPARWVEWCGQPDFDGDGVVWILDSLWCDQTIGRVLVGDEWVRP